MTNDTTSCTATPVADWYVKTQRHYFLDAIEFGRFRVLEYAHPPFVGRMPPHASFHLHVPLKCAPDIAIVMGSDRPIRSNRLAGQMLVALPHEAADFTQPSDAHGLVLELPHETVLALAAEVHPRFCGHFGHLHADFWSDNQIRDLALSIWRSARGETAAPDLGPDEALMALVRLLVHRAEYGFARHERGFAMAPSVRRRVLSYVEDNIAGDCRLITLAAVAGLSPFHFARSFRRETGDTPHRYVARRRIARARALIVSTALPLADIALASGFTSQSRMSEACIRQFGVSPGRLRTL